MHQKEGILKRENNVYLYYRSWEPERDASAAVVIVHGFGEHGSRYKNVVDTLLSMGISVHAFDNRGHGRSWGKRGHIAKWADFRSDVDFFLDFVKKQAPDKPLFLMGHSMGGLIVLDYALDHQKGINGLIVSGPALSQGAVSPVLLFFARLLSRIWPNITMDSKLDAEAVSRDPEVIRAYKNDPLVHSMASAGLGTRMQAAMDRVRAQARKITLPILIVHGGEDRLVPADTSRELFENLGSRDKTRFEYPGYFHETHNDLNWEAPVSDIAHWLEAHLPQKEA